MLEGDDPGLTLGRMMSADDAFTTWFLERVTEIHGIDLSAPMTGSRFDLVVDTAPVPALA